MMLRASDSLQVTAAGSIHAQLLQRALSYRQQDRKSELHHRRHRQLTNIKLNINADAFCTNCGRYAQTVDLNTCTEGDTIC